jgi:hypothetical protein
MDFLDILEGRYYKTHTGRYYEKLPEAITYASTVEALYELEGGIDFDYEYINPTEWRYKQIINNLSDSTAADAAIKTCEAINFKVKGYIMLDTNRICQIISIQEDVAAAQREAARLMPLPIGTEYIIRMVEVDSTLWI